MQNENQIPIMLLFIGINERGQQVYALPKPSESPYTTKENSSHNEEKSSLSNAGIVVNIVKRENL